MVLDDEIPSLDERVKAAKQILKDVGLKRAKIKFFDCYYGPLLKSESIRLDNLWAGYTTNFSFTKKLENYAEICKNKTI